MATQELTVIQRELPALVPTNVAKARLAEIRQFVKEELREGIDQDFAVIPGTGKKPSLLQPGAEKLIEKLGLSPTFPQASVNWAYENHELGEYMVDVLCQLVNLYTGHIQAECWGSAGRSAQEELDASNAKAREYNKPERSLSFRDKGLARNTAFKLAQKSALVGATLKAARLAVEFTQDVEDFNRPAPSKTEPDTSSAYFCQEHKTEWFKRGKMQRFAHPIGETGKWCNMPEPKGDAIPTTMREVPEPEGLEFFDDAEPAPKAKVKRTAQEVQAQVDRIVGTPGNMGLREGAGIDVDEFFAGVEKVYKTKDLYKVSAEARDTIENRLRERIASLEPAE